VRRYEKARSPLSDAQGCCVSVRTCNKGSRFRTERLKHDTSVVRIRKRALVWLVRALNRTVADSLAFASLGTEICGPLQRDLFCTSCRTSSQLFDSRNAHSHPLDRSSIELSLSIIPVHLCCLDAEMLSSPEENTSEAQDEAPNGPNRVEDIGNAYCVGPCWHLQAYGQKLSAVFQIW
jgi:hypothetical protein